MQTLRKTTSQPGDTEAFDVGVHLFSKRSRRWPAHLYSSQNIASRNNNQIEEEDDWVQALRRFDLRKRDGDLDGWPSRVVYAFGSNGRHQFSGDYSSMGRERRDSGQPVRYSPNAPCEASIAYSMELATPAISDGPGVLYEDPDCFAALDIKIDTYKGLLSHAVFVAIDAKRAIAYGTAMAVSVNQALANSSGTTATLPDL